MSAKYKRIILKISGEALAGENGTGLNEKFIDQVVNQLVKAHDMGVEPSSHDWARLKYEVVARRGDRLSVDFVPGGATGLRAYSVYLTGPAEKLEELDISL